MRLLKLVTLVLAASTVAVGAQDKAKPAQEKDKKKDGVSISAGDTEIGVSAEGGVKVKAGGVKIEVPAGVAGIGLGSGTASETDKEILISTSNQMVSYECKGRDVKIKGGGNAVTLKGTCKEVSVNGTGNAVWVEELESIVVQGTGNGFKWKRGVGGKTPRTTQSGVGNAVFKAEEGDEEP